MVKIMSVFGTRPEAIKMAPLIKTIENTSGLQGVVCVTAQHRQMLDQVLQVFEIKPDYDMNLMRDGQTLATITADVVTELGVILDKARPDLVLVHGDTTTSFAAALAAFYRQIPVGHVEAGLRSFNRLSPYPEEMNRRLTAQLAELHFAPTNTNVENLASDRADGLVVKTGNTVIDALHMLVREDYSFRDEGLRELDFSGRRAILLTAHRRENLGKPLEQIFAAVAEIAGKYPDVLFIYPVHKNPAVGKPARRILGNVENVKLIEPLEVDDMHNLIKRCYLVMTDSGGLQEEAPALGKPVLVLRTETERPEAVEMGTAKVVGVETPEIVKQAETLLCDEAEYQRMSRAVNPYGDGKASRRICDAILEYFKLDSGELQ